LKNLPKQKKEKKTRVPFQLVGSSKLFQGEPHVQSYLVNEVNWMMWKWW
jgi:hypothetical protein